VRVIERNELPSSGPFFVKLPGSPWIAATLEDGPQAFRVNAPTLLYSPQFTNVAVREAALAGWEWNTSESETSAHLFVVAEPNDLGLRQRLKLAGLRDKEFTLTRRDGGTMRCKLTDFPHTADALTFEVDHAGRHKTIEWFDVVEIEIDAS
jgi:hypothetical protein